MRSEAHPETFIYNIGIDSVLSCDRFVLWNSELFETSKAWPRKESMPLTGENSNEDSS